MLVWLGTRADILAAIGRQREAQRQLDTCRDEEREASAQVVAEVAALDVGTDKIQTDSLRVVIEWAEVFQREQEAKARTIGGDAGNYPRCPGRCHATAARTAAGSGSLEGLAEGVVYSCCRSRSSS